MRGYMFLVSSLIFALSTALSTAQTTNRDYWPTEQWRGISPTKAGFDENKLASINTRLVKDCPNISSLLVVRNGYMLHEKYFTGDADTLRNVRSQTKSVISLLVGVLISRGKIKDVDQKLLALLPGLQSENITENSKELTIKHLLTMTSGFPEGGKAIMLDLQDLSQFLTKAQKKQPGEAFSYNGTNADLLSLLITKTTGQSADRFASSTVFKTLGIKNYEWQTIKNVSRGDTGLAIRSRDIVKIAYLYVNNGKWAGESIIREDWVRESTYPIVNTGETLECLQSYGYLWWVGNFGKYPAYLALGYGGQLAAVLPSLDLIVVATADPASGNTLNYIRITMDYILSAMTQ
jgi:CubicO group peptidase (beta-lactamase class C family)